MSNPQPDIEANTLLVGVDLGLPHFDEDLDELAQLASTAGLVPVARMTCKRRAPDAALFVGSGKAQEIKEMAVLHGASEILFDQALSPAQQRNLERLLEMPVNDRTMLILQIFAQRARSHEGKLQVELARLQYLSTRLVRRWSHLERQRGGIGNRGGPGETQIELDKRMIGESIKRTKERLDKVKKQRNTQRRQRERNQVFNVSLVGYTNVGKSSLLNRLTKSEVFAENTLFATLDTTVRKWVLDRQPLLLSDTVGFIRKLPHHLVESFKSTLDEAREADLLLHVIDASHPGFESQIQVVDQTLVDLGITGTPIIRVYNKTDALQLEPEEMNSFERSHRARHPLSVFISVKTGASLDELRSMVRQEAHEIFS